MHRTLAGKNADRIIYSKKSLGCSIAVGKNMLGKGWVH